MAKINLLPWREKDRTQKRAEFFTLMGGAAAITAGLFLLFYIYVNAKIDYQNSRNAYLQEQIVSLDAKIKEIRLLEKKRENLLARMDAIQKLQASRPIIVRLFDEIVTTLPAGVFITSLSQSGSTVVLKGTAQSNARVSNFMRNIEESDWIASPNLTVIQSATRQNQRLSDFELRLRQAAPKNSAEDGESEDAA
jgi:type IV pilus assembly protein PilN